MKHDITGIQSSRSTVWPALRALDCATVLYLSFLIPMMLLRRLGPALDVYPHLGFRIDAALMLVWAVLRVVWVSRMRHEQGRAYCGASVGLIAASVFALALAAFGFALLGLSAQDGIARPGAVAELLVGLRVLAHVAFAVGVVGLWFSASGTASTSAPTTEA